jgi:chemotaxis protein CheX
MDIRFINPFMAGIKDVFTTMLGTNIIISKPRLKEANELKADVSAIIGFTGDALGSVALCFPLKTAVRTASKFAGEDLTREHPDFADALGELANMVAGASKVKCEGVNLNISLPRVVVGKELELLDPQATPVLLLLCDSTLGRFSTEVTMVLAAKRAAPPPKAPVHAES